MYITRINITKLDDRQTMVLVYTLYILYIDDFSLFFNYFFTNNYNVKKIKLNIISTF